jgi:nitrite reductase (NADH) small subunit
MASLHPIGELAEIPEGEGRNFEVAGRRIAVFRLRDGRVFATQAQCPHRNGPLSDGLLGGETLVCPLHEWRFNLATGETENGTCSIETYELRLEPDGTMVIALP